jgi:hypothetical protein
MSSFEAIKVKDSAGSIWELDLNGGMPTNVRAVNSDAFKDVSIQYPLPTNGDSLYSKDIDADNSDNGGFTGVVTDYFDNLLTVNTDASATNPKVLSIALQRTIQIDGVNIGCNDPAKDFSNVVIKVYGSGGTLKFTKDLSADNTKRNSQEIGISPVIANRIDIEFHTADEVCLSNLAIFKAIDVRASLDALSIITGEIENIESARGSLRISPTSEFKLEVARGNLPGLSFDIITALNRSVPSSQITVGPQGELYPFLAAASQLSIVSDDADDDVAGTGAQQIFIVGLDANWDVITETVDLAGTTPVTTTQSFLRINPGTRISAGADKTNQGNISITVGADNLGLITTGESLLKQGVYSVPRGFTAFNTNKNYTCGKADEVEIIESAEFGNNGTVVQFDNFFIFEGSVSFVPQNYFRIEERTDIDLRASRSAGTSARASVFYELLLADNDLL